MTLSNSSLAGSRSGFFTGLSLLLSGSDGALEAVSGLVGDSLACLAM